MARLSKHVTHAHVKNDWEAFVAGLKREVGNSREKVESGVKLSAYDSPDGVLKRGVYEFVRHKQKIGQGSLLEHVLDDFRTAPLRNGRRRAPRPTPTKQIRVRQKSFSENPFHCALRELPKEIRKFRGDDLNRIGRQLLYADRHDIDHDLLIGFLAQTGTMKEIAEKVVIEPEVREEWFKAKQEAEKLMAVKKSRYPLGILHFTAVSTDKDIYPIEVGFAKARGRHAPISNQSVLIEAVPDWNISEKLDRYDKFGSRGRTEELHERHNAQIVIEKLAEMSAGMRVVHCEDIGNVSHCLDMLISAAGIKTDFELRDVGDFLDHDANKRAQLWRKVTFKSASVGSAGANALHLCEAMRSLAKP